MQKEYVAIKDKKIRMRVSPVSKPSTKIQSIWPLPFTGELKRHQGAAQEADPSSKAAASVTGLQTAHAPEETTELSMA